MEAEVGMKDKKKGYDDYELDDAVRTLVRAEEIKQDKKLMKACQDRLDKKVKAVKSLADLKQRKKEYMEKMDG